MKRTRNISKEDRMKQTQLSILQNPYTVARMKCMESFYFFFMFFWDEISGNDLANNWHIKYLCDELQKIAEHRATKAPKEYDLIINIPPGTSKTSIVSIAWPVWCWTRYHWMRFITAGYSHTLSLEAAEYSRDMIRSDKFKLVFPEMEIKEDKDNKSNFRIQKKITVYKGRRPRIERGGNRFSTSVGGTLTGFHGDINIVDDPLNPHQAVSDVQRSKANRWCDKTLSSRKTDKKASITVYVMQRLHQDDPSGHLLDKKKSKIKHICLPAELKNFRPYLQPKELNVHYIDDLLDPKRMDWKVLEEAEKDMGQHEYAGQYGQTPVPPGGSMFEVDQFTTIQGLPAPNEIQSVVRYWDKAGTKNAGAYTAGLKMVKLKNGRFIIVDVKRGQWATHEREKIIRQVAEADRIENIIYGGIETIYYIEQEPGSGGKESAENTILNLAGFSIYAERPVGDKVYRADPFSVQVNNGNVMLLSGEWNKEFIEEYRYFPYGKYKDQVDAGSGAFAKLTGKKEAKAW